MTYHHKKEEDKKQIQIGAKVGQTTFNRMNDWLANHSEMDQSKLLRAALDEYLARHP